MFASWKITWLSVDDYNWKKTVTSLTICLLIFTYTFIILSLAKAGLMSLITGNNFLSDDTVDNDEDIPFSLSSKNFIFELGAGSFVKLTPTRMLSQPTDVHIHVTNEAIITTIGSFSIPRASYRAIFLPLHSRDVAGHCIVRLQSASNELFGLASVSITVKVVHRIVLSYVSTVLGWCYLFAWSATYVPQLLKNWRRRSVVGFSFDYVALNITGHLCYCAFNMGMYFSENIQSAFTAMHPLSELPVKLTDVLFSTYAVTMNALFIVQCLIYERGQQRLNVAIVTLVAGFWLVIGAGLLGALSGTLLWLRYLYSLAYIKVGSTPIKYTPQVYLNYVRKSTEGWSIEGTLLDGVGGVCSFLQMATDAYNNDDLEGTLGNPCKLGLSIIGVIFNIIFAVQHYCLYAPSWKRKPSTASGGGGLSSSIKKIAGLVSQNKPSKVYEL